MSISPERMYTTGLLKTDVLVIEKFTATAFEKKASCVGKERARLVIGSGANRAILDSARY